MPADVDIDPELIRQLDEAPGEVAAVLRLRGENASEIVPSPERTEELTHQVVGRVKKKLGAEARYNVFKNLGSFVVSGGPQLIRELIAQPEVVAAVANEQPSSPMIEPVRKAPAPPARPARVTKSRSRRRAK